MIIAGRNRADHVDQHAVRCCYDEVALPELLIPQAQRDLDALAPMRTRRDLAITRTAWRLRMLERDGEIHRLVRSGVPVVPWVRHGSLDEVLRQLQRRARAPRAARR